MNKKQFLEACKKQQSHGEFFYAVYDDFLPYEEFGALRDYMELGTGWQLSPQINANDISNNDFYMVSLIYNNNAPAREQWSTKENIQVYLNITSKLYIDAIMRVKANLYIGAKEHYIHAPHIDYDFYNVGALFFPQDCNAPTYLADGTEIESKANRILIFNSATPHASSSPTDVPYRMTINFNYFGRGVHPNYIKTRSKHIPTIKSDNYPL